MLSLFDGRVGVIAVVGVVVALVACRPLARRSGSTTGVALFALLAGLAMLLVTVANRGVDTSDAGIGHQLTWWSRRVRLPQGSDVLGWSFNAVLFVPVAFAWTLLTRRPGLVAGCLIAVSFIIETAQETVLTGRPDLLDVVANGLGAVVGSMLASVVISRTGSDPGSPPQGALER